MAKKGKMEFVLSTWDIPELDVEWLNSNIGHHFTNKSIDRIEASDMTTQSSNCRQQRLKLYFTDGSDTTIIVKNESSDSDYNKSAAQLYKTETTFYQQFAPLCQADIPYCYYASHSPDSSCHTLILESMDHHSITDISVAALTPTQAHLAVTQLGRFHATYTGSPPHPPILPPSSQHVTTQQSIPSTLFATFSTTWHTLLQNTHTPAHLDILLAVFQHCASHTTNWITLLDMLGSPTIVHGQYRADNLQFLSGRGGEERCCIRHFQSVYIGKCRCVHVYLS